VTDPAESTGRPILVAVTGGIAAYKSAYLVSRLVQAGHDVHVLMTEAATRFVTPLTFETLSGRPVHTSLWQQVASHHSAHIALARSAQLLIVAPASANTIAKLAHGVCDNLVTTVACALPRDPVATPVVFAPAMNAEMWAHPMTRRNAAALREDLGYVQVGPDAGWQACRTTGAGRMADPDAILDAAQRQLGITV
jgi:phosphopantothenoylcysteine decarboxylase/phosphopantothenate--cysteine ligase